MRILFIANTSTLYGANRSMIELAIGLRKLEQKIFFFFPQEGSLERRYQLKKILNRYKFSFSFLEYYSDVHTLRERDLFHKILRSEANRICLKKMIEIVDQWDIDVIHTNSLTHIIGAQLSKRINKPHIWHIREALKEDYSLIYDNKLIHKFYLIKANKIICISNYVRSVHSKMLMGTHSIILHNGFAVEDYLLEGAYQKTPQIFTIIICGVIKKEKGQFDAVKAVEILIHRYQIENIFLQIVGDILDEYGEIIREYIKVQKLNSYIEIIPFQSNLKELRRNADIALICSENEALGRVTIESMLSENIVIGCNSAGTAELIEDGVVGYLYEKGNIEDLSAKILYVIRNWDKQQDVVERAREYAKSNYNIDDYSKKILNIYQDGL